MAERVVQLLEIVDVEHADAERHALLLRLVQVVIEAVVEVAVVAEAGERVGEREPHRLELPKDRALVERDRGERADERGRQERRALPEHGQHQGQRGHDREGDEGRGHRPPQERDEAVRAPSGSRPRPRAGCSRRRTRSRRGRPRGRASRSSRSGWRRTRRPPRPLRGRRPSCCRGRGSPAGGARPRRGSA